MATEVQALILESGKAGGILTADVVDSVRGQKRDRQAALTSPLLKVLLDRQGLSKADLDRLLERFWAQNGGRRPQLHRMIEERIVASYLVEAGLATETNVSVAEQEFEERATGGDLQRLLSILVDTGAIDENAARQTVTEVQKIWKFCKYCLSSFRSSGANGNGGGGGDACSICGRPLTVAARAYEIVKLKTIAEVDDSSGRPRAAPAAAAQQVKLPEVGDTIAGVKLVEKINDEGRGAVYKGTRAGDGAARAIKVWRLGKDLTRDDVMRFETAALSATKLDHPGILKIYEAGEENGRHFVLSEWANARTLKEVVADKGPLAADKAGKLLLDMLKALEVAHKEKLLHKNIQPGNILLPDSGTAKLAEFGICKDYGVSLETVRGNVIGSPDYLAPEQCQGLKSDERTDLFSVGAVLYFALAGKKPFEGDSTVTLVVKRLTSDAKPLRDVAPKVPKDLADIIAKLMARKPDERFASARDAAAAVERWRAKVEAGLEGIEETGKAKKIGMILGALVLLGGVATGVVYLLLSFGGPDQAFLDKVAAQRKLADKGMFVEALEALKPLARDEGSGGEAGKALEDATQKAIRRANELAGEKNYPKAVSLLERVKSAIAGLGVPSEGALLEAEKAIRMKREAYEKEAGEAFTALHEAADKLPATQQLAKVREYRAKYPFQPLDEQARVWEERFAGKQKQLDMLEAAEKAIAAGDPSAAQDRLADAMALGEFDADTEPRVRKIRKEITFLTHMKEGDKLSAAGQVDRAVQEYNRAAEVFPDRPEVRAAIAKAKLDEIMRKAADEEKALNYDAAIERYREAETLATDARIDYAPIREKRRNAENARRSTKEREQKGREKVAEGDAKAHNNDWSGALTAYLEAEKLLGSIPYITDKIETARMRGGADAEDKDWKALEGELPRTPNPTHKVNLLDNFLQKYPAGSHAPTAREMIEKIRLEGKVEMKPQSVAPRALPLRKGDPAFRSNEVVNPSDGSAMVLVQAGKFRRGTSSAQMRKIAERWGVKAETMADEGPQRDVWVDAFYIDVHEATNADYALFLAAVAADKEKPHRYCNPAEPADKSHEPKYWGDERWARSEQPVVGVDWYDAWAYARWAGKRLPTEAEWEKAARGEDGRTYPWGEEDVPFLANSAESWQGRAFMSRGDWETAFYKSAPWKEKGLTIASSGFASDRSPYGAMHLGGNVWEWCEDWYHPDAYEKLGDRNPVASSVGKLKHRVVRGGAWLDPLLACRAASRAHHLEPEGGQASRNFELGFRCARSAGVEDRPK